MIKNYKNTIDLVGIKSNLATLLQEIPMKTMDNLARSAEIASYEIWFDGGGNVNPAISRMLVSPATVTHPGERGFMTRFQLAF